MPLGVGAILRGRPTTEIQVDLAGEFARHSVTVASGNAAWGSWNQVWAAGAYDTDMLVTAVEMYATSWLGWASFGAGDTPAQIAVWPVSAIDYGRAGRGHPFVVPAGEKLSVRSALTSAVAGWGCEVHAIPVTSARMARRSYADPTQLTAIAAGNFGAGAYGTSIPIIGTGFTTEDCRLIGLHTPWVGVAMELQITVDSTVVFEGKAATKPIGHDLVPLPWEPVVPAGVAASIKWKHPTSSGSLNPPIPILVAVNP